MLKHWAQLAWAPETRGGHLAITTLQDALVIALPYIEWPFGRYERQTGRRKPKIWHLPARLIANVVIKEIIAAGHDEPSITRNSVVVRIVRKALIRMNYPEVTNSAIGAYLTRWSQKYRQSPRTRGLTTK